MNRKEKVYAALMAENDDCGLEASQIAQITGIDRANVSRMLNELEREQYIVKIVGRPVRYMSKEKYQNWKEKQTQTTTVAPYGSEKDCFFMIGEDGSLKNQILQAKSAALYPPRGLRILFFGPTGTGKTMFVERIYDYGKHMGVLSQTAKLVTFNCAEYAENPQLILAQLFGYKKGAFTGANKDNEGLVEKAQGGILFLDEIHRLPADGQEMLFTLMDKGIYHKLGEPEKDRKADLLIMGATTENIDKALLQTFLRRMPVSIKLPSLRERPVEERLELIGYFFGQEQKNVRTPMYVSKEVIIGLLVYDCPGNIGQLRAVIQMICARAFLNFKEKEGTQFRVEPEDVSESVAMRIRQQDKNSNYLIELLKHYDNYYLFLCSEENEREGNQSKNGKNVFVNIIQKYHAYQQMGESDGENGPSVRQNLEVHMKKLLKQYDSIENSNLLSMITSKVDDAVDDAINFAELKLGRKLSEKVRLGMKLHVMYALETKGKQSVTSSEKLKDMAIGYTKELQTAKLIRKILEEALSVTIPDQELWVITLLLSDLQRDEDHKKVGLIVLAHGDSTASSMANVANTLFGTDICQAIDMPLYSSVEDTLEAALKMCAKIDEGKGVLLLTDMGSLNGFGDRIARENHQDVKVVDMVSTILVVEAVRIALLPSCELEQLQSTLHRIARNRPYSNCSVRDDVIRTVITTCISGAGTARKIGGMIQKFLIDRRLENVVIRNMDITNVKNAQAEVEKRGYSDVVAVVGTVDLKLPDIPYISIESLVLGSGMEYLEELLLMNAKSVYKETMINSATQPELLVESLNQILDFLDAEKAEETVIEVYENISERLQADLPREMRVRFIIHVCCMIERLIRGEPLAYHDSARLREQYPQLFFQIECAMEILQEKFGIQVPEMEIAYIVEMLDSEVAQ